MKGVMRKENRRERWLLRYTALFLSIILPSIACLLLSGKTLLWKLDAYYQHYPALAYTGEAVRKLLSGDGFQMVDLYLGQGLDVIGTLTYYGLFNPVHWLAALFPGDTLEIYYQFLIFAYMYISGALMCVYLKMMGILREKGWLLPLAGVLFAFCGYHSMALIKHPYFANGSIYLLLMLISVERIFCGRSFLMMSVITALMLVVNFYFGYQTTLLVIFYILIRLAFRLRRVGVKKSAKQGFTLLGGYLLGMMMSMVVLLPVIIAFMQSGRTGVSAGYTDSMLHYPIAYYLKLGMLFCAPYDYAGYWTLQSFGPLSVFALMLLFSRNRHYALGEEVSLKRQLRVGFLAALICLCVPLAGKIFNGFGYVTNRWSYGFAVVVCVITAWALPKFLAPDYPCRKHMGVLGLIWAALMLLYGLIAHKLPSLDNGGTDFGGISSVNIAPIAGGLALAASALCLILMDKKLRIQNEKAVRIVAALAAFCCICYNAGYSVVAVTSNSFHEVGVYRGVQNQCAAASESIEADGFYRVNAGLWSDNQAAMLKYHGVSHYWSMIPDWITNHYVNLELPTLRYTFRMEGLGSDSYLDSLACVGYSLRNRAEIQTIVPYGQEQIGSVTQEDGDVVEIYENRYRLPMGYVFESAMAWQDYEKLNPVEKRMALASCAVLEEIGDMPSFEDDFHTELLDWEIASMDGVSPDGNTLRVEKGGKLTLCFEGKADSETYLRLVAPTLVETDEEVGASIYVISDNGGNRMNVIYSGGNFNYAQQGCTATLGYSETGLRECTMEFTSAGVFQFEALEIISAPASVYREAMEALTARSGWNPEIECNRLNGSISLESDGILQIAVPWGDGWTAMVDGEETPILKSGGMYMGIALKSGTHEIELQYETPGLRAGAWISLTGILLAALLYAGVQLRRRRLARKV